MSWIPMIWALALALASVGGTPASALTVLSQDRFVESAAGIGALGPSARVYALGLEPFDESLESKRTSGISFGIGRASQISRVSQNAIVADGTVFTSGFSAGLGSARSEIEIVFEVVEAVGYSLAGSAVGQGDAFTSVGLFDSSGVPLHSMRSFDFGNGGPGGGFSFGGSLFPGDYTLRAFTRSCSDEGGVCGVDFGDGAYSVAFNLVPEPSTMTLIGLGLAAFSVRNRRPKSSSLAVVG